MTTTEPTPTDNPASTDHRDIRSRDWATDFDHGDPAYGQHAPEIWSELRASCPVAHSEAYGGTWLPTRFEDVSAIAYDTDHFSSWGVVVGNERPDTERGISYAPPITADPPFHADARRILLPAFSPKAVERLVPATRTLCQDLIDQMLATGERSVDAAIDYAQNIPVGVIALMLGLRPDDGDQFRGFIHRIIETPGVDHEISEEQSLDWYLNQAIAQHRAEPQDDLIGHLLDVRVDGKPLSDEHIRGTIGLLLIAGIDTTWSAIGASIWHLATHEEDRRRLVDNPALLPTAVEEFLRAYAPVTMARLVVEDTELGDQQVKEGDWVLLPFPAANRDPEQFDRAEDVVIDRSRNRHAAFGLGIHRCIGSNLARMEMTVALEEWLARIPDFEVSHHDGVRWSAGQIRGPRELPVDLLRTLA